MPPPSYGMSGRAGVKTSQDFSEKSSWQSAEEVFSHFLCFPLSANGAVAGQTLDQLIPMARRERRKLPRLADTYSGRNGKAVQSGKRAKERASYGLARITAPIG